jgi:hypothetical protein
MRCATILRTSAVSAFLAFALTAYVDPDFFNGAHARADHGLVWLAISVLAAACAAKLILPLTLFGWRVSLPLFLVVAAVLFARVLAWRALAQAFATLPPWRSATTPSPGPPPAPQARINVALAAAARARK